MAIYGYQHAYRSYCMDVAQPGSVVKHAPFDAVLADVPCSGSGNWNRSPEQFYFFTKQKSTHYSSLQQQVGQNAIRNCKPGGREYYITCSLFHNENVQVVKSLIENESISLHEQHLVDASMYGGDYMFIAILEKH